MTCEKIEATYKIITPLFCGGAGGDTAELRVPSIKGVLRWWWRALAWSRHQGEEADKLRAIHREEAALFGSPDHGQSKVLLRLLPSATPRMLRAGDVLIVDNKVVGEGARYLGYGVMEAFDRENRTENKKVEAGQLTRACLEAPCELRLELRARDLDQGQCTSLLDALRALGIFGGLGAKSRKGYGSLVLKSLSVDGKPSGSSPASAEALATAIASLIPAASATTSRPPYTALSPRTRVVLFSGRDRQRPLELLDVLGREMMRYRSWGHHGKVLGFDREENFRDDHDLMKEPPGRRHTHPRRIVFGLPHNYGKRPADKVGPGDSEDGDRRASPLLIHIHECGATPVAVLSFLPARFLSNGDRAKIDVGGARVTIARDQELWKPIHGFLDRFFDPRRKDLAGRAQEVQP